MSRALLFLLAALLATSLAAQGKTTVTVVSWYPTDPGGLLDMLKREFEAHNPDYEIVYSTISGNYYDGLQTMLASGAHPDVAMLGFDWIATMAENGMAMNIDKWVRESFPVDEMFPSIQRALQWKGQYYALSRDITARVFYYNAAHLRESGFGPPQDGWTWDDFLDIARKTHRTSGDTVTRWGYAMQFVLDGHYQWFPTNGGDWFNHDRTELTINTPANIETMQFLQDLIYQYGVAPSPTQLRSISSPSAGFLNGVVAMQVGGSGVPDAPDIEWGIVQMPEKVQPGTRVWSNLWFIPSGAPNPEAAWKVLSFFGGPIGQRIAYQAGTGIPAIRSVAVEMDIHPGVLKAFEIGTPYPVIANRAVWDVFNATFPKLWSGEMPATAVAETIQSLAEPLMKR